MATPELVVCSAGAAGEVLLGATGAVLEGAGATVLGWRVVGPGAGATGEEAGASGAGGAEVSGWGAGGAGDSG